jgi:MFS family permease
MIGFAVVFLSLIVCTLLSGWIAGRRGRSTRLWYWLGAIFGPFAPVVIALLPPAREPTGRPPNGRPPALSASQLWRRMLGRAFGGQGESHRFGIALTRSA